MQWLIHSFSQTLTKLNLRLKRIGDQDAECLAHVLQQNKVTLFTLLDFLYNYSCIISYRHSQHWTSEGTKSMTKAQNI